MSGAPFDPRQFFTLPGQADTSPLQQFLRQGKSKFAADVAQAHFHRADIPLNPQSLADYLQFLHSQVVEHSVRLGDPRFIGHMTSVLPDYLAPLHQLVNSLNQNLVKLETSGAFTAFERQALALLHRLVYARDDAFYSEHTQDPESTLGMMVSGGTLGNVAALWCARNRCFAPRGNFAGVEQEGLAAALQEYGARRALVIGSSLMHYSLRKAVGLLGLGEGNLIGLTPTPQGQLDLDLLDKTIRARTAAGDRIVAIIGIAGTTETGAVDPLPELADLAKQAGIHLHIDAAWGGPTLFSARHAQLLAGIEQADSVVIDGHKQMWLPMGTGMLVFKDPSLAKGIEKTANYIIRSDSGDLGRRSLEGSRPATAVYLHAAFHLLGRTGLGQLIDGGIECAAYMAAQIAANPAFELVAAPVLNILTYRYLPSDLRNIAGAFSPQQQARLNAFTVRLQMRQRDSGAGFVSRTRLFHTQAGDSIEVLRAVLANPLTSRADIDAVLAEQQALGQALEQEAAGLFDLFAERVLSSPQAIALYDKGQAISYARLAEKATRISHQLRRAQIAPGTIVGLAAERSEAYMAGMLAIIQVGACFMPLDPAYPAERLRYMLRDSAAPLVLVDAAGAAALAGLCSNCVRVDFWLEQTAACAIDLAAVKRAAEDALYVMYTSGSSGDAKGVVGLQGATLNRLHWMWRQFPFAAGEVCCLKTSPSFVDSIWEMLGPLLAGVPAVIAAEQQLASPATFVELLASYKVTRILLLPSLFKSLLNTTLNLAERLPALWLWTLSGEAVPTELAADFRTRIPQGSLLNLYGSTEVAADVTYWLLSPQTPIPSTPTLPIGWPIDQVQLYLLNAAAELAAGAPVAGNPAAGAPVAGSPVAGTPAAGAPVAGSPVAGNPVAGTPVAQGQEGELYVAGAALAQGYLHRPELTAARFLTLPHICPQRLFRTGDRAWQMRDGTLVYSGRVDDQVKINGVQVEPAEVERALLLMDEIIDAAVIAAGLNQALQLQAYVVLRAGKQLGAEQIRHHLIHHLIAAAIPAAIYFLPQLPRTPNGKVARAQLAALGIDG